MYLYYLFILQCLPAAEKTGKMSAVTSCWYDLNQHSLQPSWTTPDRSDFCTPVTEMMQLCHNDGFVGGGCLELVGQGKNATWELFKTNVPLQQSGLMVEVTLKCGNSSPDYRKEWHLVLHLR